MSYRRDAQLIMLDARPHDALRLTIAEDRRTHVKGCRGQRRPPEGQWRAVERVLRDVSGGHRSQKHEFILLECPDPRCDATVVIRAADLSRIVALALPL
jgi:hypothetical protein